VLEVPCEVGDELWGLDSAGFRRRMLLALESTLGVREGEVIDVHDVVVANAYPVLSLASAPHVGRLREYLDSFDGMTLVGRNARFRYSSIHDMFRGARIAIDAIAAERTVGSL
ncbi:MAG TPA: hypothetical protein VNA88_18495, partial [Candidatus Kapabacteria bacterium]|nr:hypothetical protein [Candidatus Kapabacteria bacterium]